MLIDGWYRKQGLRDAVQIEVYAAETAPMAVAENIAHAMAGQSQQARFDGHGDCFSEVGCGKAGVGGGNFYAEPKPVVTLRQPSWLWHLGKVWVEKSWLYRTR